MTEGQFMAKPIHLNAKEKSVTHKIKTSSGLLFLAVVFSIIVSFPIGGAIYYVVCSIIAGNIAHAFLWAFIILVFSPLIVLMFFGVNRLDCIIEYNEETNEVSRKGCFRKFEYSVNVNNIKDVIIVNQGRGGLWIELIDDVQRNFDNFYKNSYIGFKLTEKSVEFVKLFWDKPITKIMKDFKLEEISDYDKRLYGLK